MIPNSKDAELVRLRAAGEMWLNWYRTNLDDAASLQKRDAAFVAMRAALADTPHAGEAPTTLQRRFRNDAQFHALVHHLANLDADTLRDAMILVDQFRAKALWGKG